MKLLLLEEQECLKRRIGELEAVQKQHAVDMKEALSQSSETWHDNAPRDAILESAHVTSNALQGLVETYNEVILGKLEEDEFMVGLGTVFALDDGSGNLTSYQVTGTQNFLNIENGLPYDSPLGKIVYGREFYDSVEFKGKDYTISPV